MGAFHAPAASFTSMAEGRFLEHDPEKCAAVFRKDHAQAKSQSAMTIQLNLIAL
jgi:hypothetical protein